MSRCILAHLRDTLSIKGIRRVVLHEPLSNIRPVIFLQFAPGTPQSEVWRGLNGAAMLKADCGKIVIAVSEDIDPHNIDAVFWSMAYRANMGEDLHVDAQSLRRSWAEDRAAGTDSTLLIDATLKQADAAAGAARAPIHGTGPHHVGGTRPARAQARPPWHGYSLGEWDEAWDRYAERAVEGRWAENGAETLARRRGGLTPETPVRQVEKADKRPS